MLEFRETVLYRIGSMVENSITVGQITEERCPQCGARILANKVHDEWCWNCDYISESLRKFFDEKGYEENVNVTG